ncbi:unnamed protein product [Nesidiocoris tenuis]|uniref:Uncharacterized protein n=1 Tax=Nesidiocoris tenuis TaxID=355587 RepID=A0A6H5HFH9_9HEMI|nr:unnamed protein product [Nesidiocoris tenuis]CAB0016106.1 unnamed protein product [Nesidiocoris tenuis]
MIRQTTSSCFDSIAMNGDQPSPAKLYGKPFLFLRPVVAMGAVNQRRRKAFHPLAGCFEHGGLRTTDEILFRNTSENNS